MSWLGWRPVVPMGAIQRRPSSTALGIRLRAVFAQQSPLVRLEEAERGGGCRVPRLLHAAQKDDLHRREDVILVARRSARRDLAQSMCESIDSSSGVRDELVEDRQQHILDLTSCRGI